MAAINCGLNVLCLGSVALLDDSIAKWFRILALGAVTDDAVAAGAGEDESLADMAQGLRVAANVRQHQHSCRRLIKSTEF
jgi:hypothetical protein